MAEKRLKQVNFAITDSEQEYVDSYMRNVADSLGVALKPCTVAYVLFQLGIKAHKERHVNMTKKPNQTKKTK